MASSNFWYYSTWRGCSNCDSEFDIEYWEFGDDANTRAVFGIAWFSTLGAALSTLCVVISGRGVSAVSAVLSTLVGIITFFFLPIAVQNDSLFCPETGPCGSFAGTSSDLGVDYFWGPSYGWLFAILAGIWMIIIFGIGFGCCLCNKFRSKRKGYNQVY